MKIEYNVKGSERKTLVGAISKALNAPTKYLGMPTAAYEVGGYIIDKNGIVTGEDNHKLVSDLCELHNFKAESEEYDASLPQTESPKSQRKGILDIIVDELNENASDGEPWERLHSTPQMECGDGRWRNLDGTYASETRSEDNPQEEKTEQETETTPNEATSPNNAGVLVIEMPLTGFTPEKLDNLFKLVNAKASLLKMALGTNELPIKQTEDTLQFPWFCEERVLTSDETTAYATLISLLCKTAKKKKRVTAKEKDDIDNPKYAMRCFLLSLGFIGDEYKTARQILLSKLDGNASFKSGQRKQKAAETKMNDVAEMLADAELIHSVNASFEEAANE